MPGIEALIGTDLIDHTNEDRFALQQGNTDGIRRILMDEIRGAVERIHHPTQGFCPLVAPLRVPLSGPLLRDKACLW